MSRIPRLVAAFLGLVLLADAVVCGVLVVKAETTTSSYYDWGEPVDALVVFYERPDSFRRVDAAIEALRGGRAQHLLMVGGCRPREGRFGALEMATYAIEAGIPPDIVHVDGGSFDTKSNLAEALKVAGDMNWNSIAFVSDPLHLLRIRKIASASLPLDSMSAGRSVASPYTGGALGAAWRAQHETLYMMLSAVVSESLLAQLIQSGRTGQSIDTQVDCVGDLPR